MPKFLTKENLPRRLPKQAIRGSSRRDESGGRLLYDLNNLFHHSRAPIGFHEIPRNGVRKRSRAVRNIPNHCQGPSGFNPGPTAEPLPVTLLEPGQPIFPSDPHRKPGRKVRINKGADEIVEGRKPWSTRCVKDRKILGVGICVSDEGVENDPRERGLLIRSRACALLLQQAKASFQRRPSLGFVFLFRKDPQGLAEIFLVNSQDSPPADTRDHSAPQYRACHDHDVGWRWEPLARFALQASCKKLHFQPILLSLGWAASECECLARFQRRETHDSLAGTQEVCFEPLPKKAEGLCHR